MRVKLDLDQLRMLVQQHRQMNDGRAPAALSELPLERVFYPADLEYDAASGTVRSRAYPDL